MSHLENEKKTHFSETHLPDQTQAYRGSLSGIYEQTVGVAMQRLSGFFA
jgi:hypothetical protein